MIERLKCRACKRCDGIACRGELPGMGGVFNSAIFIENVRAWKHFYKEYTGKTEQVMEQINKATIRLAPMAGGVQNVGWKDEKDFYFSMIEGATFANLPLSIGDGEPDEKLEYGLLALKNIGSKAAVFLKPYPQKTLLERIEKAKGSAEIIGVDIDSYNIITMRTKVSLEEKSAKNLMVLKEKACLPFAIKGIFSKKDMELVKEVLPDVAIISNHGGRIERDIRSSASFLKEYGRTLSKYVGELWVDGGIRDHQDIMVATFLGAKEVMIGRPIISAMIRGGKEEIKSYISHIKGNGQDK